MARQIRVHQPGIAVASCFPIAERPFVNIARWGAC